MDTCLVATGLWPVRLITGMTGKRTAHSAVATVALLVWLPASPVAAQNNSEITALAWTNPIGAKVELNAPRTFNFPITNRGTFKITDTVVSFAAPYLDLGAYVSDPSTNLFTDLTIGPSGYLSGGAGDVWIISGNFTNNSTRTTLWNTGASELDFNSNANPHSFALAGAALGASYFGYVNNFAWGIFRLRSGQSLSLSDGNGTTGAAFYAIRVVLDNGTAQVRSITGNGFSIYYDPTDAANNYLLTGAPNGIYNLAGGGVLAPVVAVLQITSITRASTQHVVLQCLGVPNRVNHVEFSPDLSAGSFQTLPNGSVSVGPTGNFSLDDAGAVGQSRRFYRIAFP